ncbi:helix-turn-helix domain-containing protein [Chryseomicrobium sp. FSL W7-1435]|uniref:helix-turn-helix domain-containing protein n=1 Tax=Chryseomicrobium sp. FSL W7-1435 TaxID=2921704 RepID=UPI003159EFDA
MNKSLFESLKTSLNEAIDHADGKHNARTRKITIKPLPTFSPQDIKEIRKKVEMTQLLFAQTLGVSKKTVEAWEAGTNVPNGSAMRLLQLLEEQPTFVTQEVYVTEASSV